MIKRTIKPAAGQSRISQAEAISAARTVYRDLNTGRFVILSGDLASSERERARPGPARRRAKKH
jgi:hypothetical protein